MSGPSDHSAQDTGKEAWIEEFLRNRHPEWLETRWLNEMLPYHFPTRGKRILDVGCGVSLIGYSLLKAGAESYTGIDCNSEVFRPQASWAKEVLPYRLALPECFPGRIKYLEMSADLMSFADNSFDLVMAVTVTEHLQDIKRVLREVKRVLVPGGYFHFSHHNYFCWDGHHQFGSVDQVERGNLTELQTRCLDWGHLEHDVDDPNVYLNKIRWQDLRRLVDQEFIVVSWKNNYSPVGRGAAKLTSEIIDRFSDRYTYEDLAVMESVCLCKKPGTTEAGVLSRFAPAEKSGLEETVESLREENRRLELQLRLIRQSTSWRLVRRYWRALDSPITGRFLRPIRWALLKTLRRE